MPLLGDESTSICPASLEDRGGPGEDEQEGTGSSCRTKTSAEGENDDERRVRGQMIVRTDGGYPQASLEVLGSGSSRICGGQKKEPQFCFRVGQCSDRIEPLQRTDPQALQDLQVSSTGSGPACRCGSHLSALMGFCLEGEGRRLLSSSFTPGLPERTKKKPYHIWNPTHTCPWT